MITKTDFRQYLEAPLHLWASKHGKIEVGPSLQEQHSMQQGQEVEGLAQIFAEEILLSEIEGEISFQKTYEDGDFQARTDILVRHPEDHVVDVYEVKGETSIKKEDRYDVTFQRLVCEASEQVRSVYIIHLNKEYIREEAVDLSQLFVVENMDPVVDELRLEVQELREAARITAAADSPMAILSCLKPDECPCPNLCHKDLPEFPIFDIPRLNKNKARTLIENGIRSILDIPDNFSLSAKQRALVDVLQAGEPRINKRQISREFQNLDFPLSFLDYETYGPAIPFFDNYGPFKPIVFQYSLHILNEPGSELEHFEFLSTENEDPGPALLQKLAEHLPENGSVIVWHQPFEKTRNKEMAERYPEYREFIENMNDRVYDLKEIVSKGMYIHPDFHGSASIKKVLPVLVPDLDQGYTGMQISDGQEAMLAWYEIVSGEIDPADIDQVRTDLLAYCELDTLAMVKIFQEISRELE